MSMYDIEITYTTGNSFGSERLVEDLCNPVTSLDVAKENLKRIKEHYIKYEDSPNTGGYYQLTLLTDGKDRTISPFWIGYFETLHGARVIAEADTDMEFEI